MEGAGPKQVKHDASNSITSLVGVIIGSYTSHRAHRDSVLVTVQGFSGRFILLQTRFPWGDGPTVVLEGVSATSGRNWRTLVNLWPLVPSEGGSSLCNNHIWRVDEP